MAALTHKIRILHHLNMRPEIPSDNWTGGQAGLYSEAERAHNRVLSLKQERRLSECFALLASISDDPRKVVAACIEEHVDKQQITVKIAVNHGELTGVKEGLESIVKAVQRSRLDGQYHQLAVNIWKHR